PGDRTGRMENLAAGRTGHGERSRPPAGRSEPAVDLVDGARNAPRHRPHRADRRDRADRRAAARSNNSSSSLRWATGRSRRHCRGDHRPAHRLPGDHRHVDGISVAVCRHRPRPGVREPSSARRVKVALDAHMVAERETGNETYVVNLLRGLAELQDNETPGPHPSNHYLTLTTRPYTLLLAMMH